MLQYLLRMAFILLLLAMMASTATTTTAQPSNPNATSTASSSKGAIRSAQKAHNLIFAGYVLLLVLTAFGTYWVWSSGNRVQEAVQGDADARIEEAKRGASEANAKSDSLEKDNLVLRGQVATLESNASNAQKELAGLQTKAADAIAAQQRVELELTQATSELRSKQTELEEAQRKTAEAQKGAAVAQLDLKKYVEEVAKRQQPRPIPEVFVINELKKARPGKLLIWYQEGSNETYMFADHLRDTIAQGGWSVPKQPTPITSLVGIRGGTALADLVIVSKEGMSETKPGMEETPIFGMWKALMAMVRYGAIHGVGQGTDDKLPEDTVEIYVGPKM